MGWAQLTQAAADGRGGCCPAPAEGCTASCPAPFPAPLLPWLTLLVCSRCPFRLQGMVPFELFGQAWVLFRDAEGRPSCVLDECAHRACPLSVGRVVDGQIECPYHGASALAPAAVRLSCLLLLLACCCADCAAMLLLAWLLRGLEWPCAQQPLATLPTCIH